MSSTEIEDIPSDLKKEANLAIETLLPSKSKEKYNRITTILYCGKVDNSVPFRY